MAFIKMAGKTAVLDLAHNVTADEVATKTITSSNERQQDGRMLRVSCSAVDQPSKTLRYQLK